MFAVSNSSLSLGSHSQLDTSSRKPSFLTVTEISPPNILSFPPEPPCIRGADKSLARPGRKQATATEDFEFHISYL